MMTNKHTTIILTFLLCLGLAAAVNGCKKSAEARDKVVISQNGGTDSHNVGRNCMDCHRQGDDGTGWFSVSGTVYNASGAGVSPNGTVRLYSGSVGGDVILELEVDGLGNFFTTEAVDFAGGLYTDVTSAAGNTRMMVASITSGACNSCHGSSGTRIKVD